ncbi:MAG: hypothetical protein J6Q72_07455 [Clostridia bacterium]|nr:hypothetical protein [Clostridia bacterium]
MKKTLAIIFALVLSVSFVFTAYAAEYTVDEDGAATYDTAVGYVFDIEDVDGQIIGEDATLLTSAEGIKKCSPWVTWFIAEKIDGSEEYRVVTDSKTMEGRYPNIKLEENQIIMVVHSASRHPDHAADYPNWQDKVAAMAVKKGDCLKLDGIDLEAGTCVNGTVTVITEDQVEYDSGILIYVIIGLAVIVVAAAAVYIYKKKK